ncbi:MAG: hypothetical protein A2157_03095 [Deltaproteobacteria bacterium RBG_16_47_11]|nr:MAG: hypothetical protein A2157_03095 [Deltaproteobacteria bacterium RBG_16_47_11]
MKIILYAYFRGITSSRRIAQCFQEKKNSTPNPDIEKLEISHPWNLGTSFKQKTVVSSNCLLIL